MIRNIVDRNFQFKIPCSVLELNLPIQSLGIYAYLNKIADKNGMCLKQQQDIYKDLNISHATYVKYRNELAKKNYLIGGKSLILIHPRKKDGGINDDVIIEIVDIEKENKLYFEIKIEKNKHSNNRMV